MVEFAIISFVMSAIVAGLLGILVLGLNAFQTNIASENIGRLLDGELAVSDANPQKIFEAINPDGRGLYDETRLILAPEDFRSDAFRSTLPEVNRLLLSNYVYDRDRDVYRYPGAVVTNADGNATVLVPLLPDPAAGFPTGMSRSRGLDNTAFPSADNWAAPVSFMPTDLTNKFKVVVIHPSQPASTIRLNVVHGADGRIISQTPVVADDSAINLGPLPTGYSIGTAPATNLSPSSSGQYGLGRVYAFTQEVRPFRAVFESSSVFAVVAE